MCACAVFPSKSHEDTKGVLARPHSETRIDDLSVLRMKGWGYQPVQFHAFTHKENRILKGKLLVCQQKTN